MASTERREWTYRAQGIPEGHDKKQATELLNQLLGVDTVCIRSLTDEYNGSKEQVATFHYADKEPLSQSGVTGSTKDRYFSCNEGSEWVVISKNFIGFTPLNSLTETEHTADCIAITGLNGHAFGSFAQRNSNWMWLRDHVPKLPAFQGMKVYVYGYKSEFQKSHSHQTLDDIARDFQNRLRILRKGSRKGSDAPKPLIFIVHSMGGLLLKQAIVNMCRSNNAEDSLLPLDIAGILSFGVPNEGMDISNWLSIVESHANENLVRMLDIDSAHLEQLCKSFNHLFHFRTASIFSWYETHASQMLRLSGESYTRSDEYMFLIRPASAVSGRHWERDEDHNFPMSGVTHSELVKFGPKDQSLDLVVSKLEELIEKNTPAVQRSLQARAANIRSLAHTGTYPLDLSPDLTERKFRHGTSESHRSGRDEEGDRAIIPRSCRCKCHKQHNIRYPKLVKHYLGYMAMQLNYTNRCQKCITIECRRVIPATVESHYYFPQWLLARKIYIAICQYGKPGIQLFFPSVIPDSSDIFKFCMNGNLEGVQSLFREGKTSPTDVSYDYGWTALHYALSYDQHEIAKYLVEQHKMDKNAENLNGTTPADIAWNRIWGQADEPNPRIRYEILLGTDSRDDHIEKRMFTPLHRIALGIEPGIIEDQVKETDVDAPDSSGRSALSYATARGDEAVSIALLKCCASIVLKQPGADSLHWAVTAKDPVCVKLLLDRGADCDSRSVYGETSLHIAAMRYDDPFKRMDLLLAYGASIDAQDYEGSTPLIFAVLKKHPVTVQFLLDKGANIDLTDHNGMPAVAFAILGDDKDILDILLKHSRNTSWLTGRGKTWLHLSADSATSLVLISLREEGLECDFDRADRDGYTADQIFDCRRRSRGVDLATVEAFDKLLASLRISDLSLYTDNEKSS